MLSHESTKVDVKSSMINNNNNNQIKLIKYIKHINLIKHIVIIKKNNLIILN
jgi:hypothetical protein